MKNTIIFWFKKKEIQEQKCLSESIGTVISSFSQGDPQAKTLYSFIKIGKIREHTNATAIDLHNMGHNIT